jgi:hypothetical protein
MGLSKLNRSSFPGVNAWGYRKIIKPGHHAPEFTRLIGKEA